MPAARAEANPASESSKTSAWEAGTFVTADGRHGDVRLAAAARAFAVEARTLGVSNDEAVAAVFEALSISAEHHPRA